MRRFRFDRVRRRLCVASLWLKPCDDYVSVSVSHQHSLVGSGPNANGLVLKNTFLELPDEAKGKLSNGAAQRNKGFQGRLQAFQFAG